ncbi:glycosyltransferase [Aquibacillus rhizosphaerae]|uniref:Glycosyltransferase n=1 Tax=Aquibacillus rhizosphaerae TaxID=3051431 RepID=A0ABT7L0T3_9BACI|nr:glycosyltransferase [Aquibacillus sp. LR5S19]MDL4838954.1 glycosyltransferase [Aquibacillus sp. LR5S19]
MGYNVLFFPWRDWDSMQKEGFRTREANLLIAMMKNPEINKVLCINRSKKPFYIQKLIEFKNGGEFEKGKQFKNEVDNVFQPSVNYSSGFSNLIQVDEKLYVLNINYHIPNPKGNKLETYNFFKNLLYKEVNKAISAIGFTHYLTWCFDLTRIDIANKLKQEKLIFDSIDNLLEHDQNRKDYKHLSEMYKVAEENADVVFTVSREIKETLFSKHINTHYIPNAINLDLYKSKTWSRPTDLPNGKPIVGYIGLMQERIDLEIIGDTIKKNNGINYVFIGPILSKKYFRDLRRYSNVYLLGAKHHSLIPSYLNYFDICIIPHKVNKFTESMNPLKLYEYLAAGKEVVTTPVPPSEDYKDVIHIAHDENQFSQIINGIVNKPYNEFSRKEIIESVNAQDWNSRLNNMLKIIQGEGESDA